MSEKITMAPKWNLDGGVLCLDFINTIPDRSYSKPHDRLTDFSKILEWCKALGLIDEKEFGDLSAQSAEEPGGSKTAFKKYIDTRENLWKILSAVAAGIEPAQKEVNQFSKSLSEALAKLKFEFTGNSIHLGLAQNKDHYYNPLDRILKSAFDLLTKEQQDRIKYCGECGVLFLDVSKNNTRQWCNPSSCGTVIRSRRYQKKKKENIISK